MRDFVNENSLEIRYKIFGFVYGILLQQHIKKIVLFT